MQQPLENQQTIRPLFVISAPSGAGKTSLIAAALERDKQLQLSVSYTTRTPRIGESDGQHYHFVDVAAFKQRVDSGDFLEHASVFGNAYGTSRAAIYAQQQAGFEVVLEIDWQGARQVMSATECISIFILPPSLDALQQRLDKRQTDSQAIIAERMAQARAEISHWHEYEYLLVNDSFEETVEQLLSIIQASRLHHQQQSQEQRKLIDELLEN